MTDIKERIEAIKPYFVSYIIAQGACMVSVKLEDGWKIPKKEYIKKTFGVDYEIKNGLCLFGVEMDEDYGPIFDCIDYIIKRNLDAEEMNNLLDKYHDALEELAKKMSLEEFRKLKFIVKNENTQSKRGGRKKVEEETAPIIVEEETPAVIVEEEIPTEEAPAVDQTTEVVENIVETFPETLERIEEDNSIQEKPKKKGNSLVNKAKKLTE